MICLTPIWTETLLHTQMLHLNAIAMWMQKYKHKKRWLSDKLAFSIPGFVFSSSPNEREVEFKSGILNRIGNLKRLFWKRFSELHGGMEGGG